MSVPAWPICGSGARRSALRVTDGQDVTKRDTEIRSALARGVASRVGKESYELWFAGGEAISLSGETLVVQAGSQFKLDRIRSSFRAELEAASQEVLQHVPAIEFRVVVPAVASNGSAATQRKVSPPTSSSVGDSSKEPAASATSSRRRFANLRTFVSGPSNRLAVTSCEMVVDRPGEMTPLYLHGPPGVGKTHLLEGIWSAIRTRRRLTRLVYLTAEQFTSYFLEALKGSGLPNFRRKYRGADVLILDDVQFFAGKNATVTELQHTVDEMLRDGRQLVLAADRPPAQLTQLGESLIARLSSGVVCNIKPPQRETRLAIARQLATVRKMEVPLAVLEYIADQFSGDARQTAGALNRLQATATAFDCRIDLSLAWHALADLVRASCRPVQLGEIEKAVCENFGLEKTKLQSPQKSKTVSHPRMLAMYLARKHTRAGLSEIGSHFGRRSHTTVVSAEKRVNRWLKEQSSLTIDGRTWTIQEAIAEIETRLRIG